MDYASFAAKAKETVKKNKEKTLKGETKTKKEEWIVDNAAQYFFNEGINEEGLAIFIEELGVENFVEFVHDLAEDSELIEAYALTGKKKTPKRLPKGTQPAKTTKATIARGDRTIKAASPSGAFKKRPAASKAVETAKEKQPEKKPVKSTLVKGVADTLARGALSAWQGHKDAMKKKKEGKSVASQVGAGLATAAGSMLRKGKKHLSDDYQYSDWRDDFKAMEYEFIDLIKPEPLVTEEDDKSEISRDKRYQTSDFSREVKKRMDKMRNDPNHNVYKVLKANAEKKKQQNEESERYVRGTAPVRDPQTGESYPREIHFRKTHKKKSKKVEVSEGDKYDNVGKQAARMSLLNNPGPRSTPEQTAEKKARLEKKRGMKLDDHPQFKKEEVEEGYRVVSTSFKSGDGDPKDDVTIKKQKKVVSGDNLTKKGAERSANARRQEYGAGDAFQVQKTKTAKKRSSNAASEAEVKAKIDAKEKKQQKSRAQQSIAGMNRAGTPSGKVAAARLKTDKKFNKEEVDKRRAPKELLDRLNSRMVGWMADDGPNKPAYDAKQRLLKKAYEKRKRKGMEEEVETIDEAGKKCWKGYKKAGTQKLFGKTYNRCVKANESAEIDEKFNTQYKDKKKLGQSSERKSLGRGSSIKDGSKKTGYESPKEFRDASMSLRKHRERFGDLATEAKDETEIGITGLPIPKKKRSPKKQYEFEKARRKNLGTNVGGKTYKKDVTPYYNPRVKEEVESDWRSEIEEGAAWTKKSGKNPSGGLNEKGRKSYERENPGSDLKRPSKKKGNKRRKSFCARMKGMKKKLTSKETANDPNSRINKSLRAWNC